MIVSIQVVASIADPVAVQNGIGVFLYICRQNANYVAVGQSVGQSRVLVFVLSSFWQTIWRSLDVVASVGDAQLGPAWRPICLK